MNIDGSVALITGAASGLGLATAKTLHAAGASVVLFDLPGTRAGAEAEVLGERARAAEGDVTDPILVEAAFEVASELGPVRIVVNCAGIATPGKIIGREGPLDLATFERVVRINLVGTFNVLRIGAAVIAATEPVGEERGVIVNTASVAAFDGQIGQPAYAASKAGIVGLTLPAARELASFLIRVVTIAPGIFETPLLAGLPEAARRSLGEQVPHPSRLGKPEEYAALVRHIVENPLLNGETIRLDGAIRMAPR
ncbi:SDR family NAD(P)-dependent oxidoreductase [Cryobacterium sp. TMT1-3]|uniref:SDR family NAD(P)-dependent oxidoreductase n=1 Tax=Cryobacterium luteum TaxID=1424661 RepID=A0A1H8LZ57_9MICO|nr:MULTISPECIES: SDR family NAD(P)-dependent oxidoreductase [Cryobacterium]TFB85223.1 SDR family NAD(P)-dependent oxidoreductase [Cryobacterium luteum]TFC29133.1 SDR family NAD(P)-dependent oxidoreductase [Cryobacterium sp. TMT1-3]SEO10361.1 NAD(P)-dependent dehydrogenase, short-chain alcohol dehydrogenase family [Cryobacterium luteum]